MFLWAKSCNIVVYFYNQSPHKVLGKLTHEEALKGKKLDLAHIHMFGCLVYFHVPSKKRTKLEPIIMGHSETSKSCKVYILALWKTMIHIDVRFEEQRALMMYSSIDSPIVELQE